MKTLFDDLKTLALAAAIIAVGYVCFCLGAIMQ